MLGSPYGICWLCRRAGAARVQAILVLAVLVSGRCCGRRYIEGDGFVVVGGHFISLTQADAGQACLLLDAGAAKPARDWGNGTTPTIKARRRTRSWEGIQQAGTRAGGEREGAFQQMVRIGASGSRRGGSARPRARRGAAWAQPGERRKKRTEACLGSSCSARSRWPDKLCTRRSDATSD